VSATKDKGSVKGLVHVEDGLVLGSLLDDGAGEVKVAGDDGNDGLGRDGRLEDKRERKGQLSIWVELSGEGTNITEPVLPEKSLNVGSDARP
jgi:hypothetical protein